MINKNDDSRNRFYSVKAGDTLYSISQSFGIPVRILMAANKITNPHNLQIGRKIIIPKYPCCNSYGNNQNTPPNNNYNGPIIYNPMPMVPPIDPGPEIDVMPDTPATPEPMPDIPAMPEPICKGSYYTVSPGDSFYMIAKKHRINLNALLEANPYIDPYNLIIGTKLCIPSR